MPCMHVYIYVEEGCNLDMVRVLCALYAAPWVRPASGRKSEWAEVSVEP